MTKHTFMDTILKRPSQRYTDPAEAKSSRNGRYQTPNDLPNAPNRPDSILAGNMFNGAGAGSLSQAGGAANYSRAPSVMSGHSNTSRFSLFRKKGGQPSISGGSVYYDGSSSIAATDIAASSPRKGRWWETGTRHAYSSRPPSVAGSVFSEPEAAGPPGFPRISDSFHAGAPPRGARSDYGGSTRKRYSSQPTQPPPLPPLANKASMSSMKRQSGVMPLGQQQPNLMRQASTASLVRSPSNANSNVDLNRPVSPAASMGRKTTTQPRAAPNGSSDWNSFVKSMSGTEVAKMWESMPTLAPKQPRRTSDKRSSIVADRIRKELEQDAQFQQIQRDPGVVQQDLLARAASQVIGAMPPTPVSPLSEPQLAPLHLQPGQVVAPISPIYSPVASSSSLNVAQHPPAIPLHASTFVNGAGVPAPVVVPQPMAAFPVSYGSQPQPPFVHPQAVSQHYNGAVPAEALQQYTGAASATAIPQQVAVAPTPVPVLTAPPASAPHVQGSPAQTYALVAVTAPRTAAQPPAAPQLAAAAATQPVSSPSPQALAPPPAASSTATVAPPTTAQLLADRVEEQESADEHAAPQESSSDESEESDDSDDTSSDEGLVGGGQPTLDVVAEEDEEASSIGHNFHHEMRSRKSSKGKGLSRNYDDYEARLHSRHVSAQSQPDDAGDDAPPLAPSGVQIQVTEPLDAQPVPTPTVSAEVAQKQNEPATQEAPEASAAPSQVPALPSQQPDASERPQLVSRASEVSEYQSVASGRSTPSARDQDDDDQEQDDEAAVASIANAQIGNKISKESISNDAASIAPSQRPSIRTTRSSRPGTAQRRLSELSLGTSFAASGILRRPESTRRQTAESDSGAELSDDDADLRAQALAEQDRLRKMNVGEDFFGPSLSSILDKFDGFGSTDSSASKLKREPESPFVSKDITTEISHMAVAATAPGIDGDAQKVMDEVRQNRADAAAESKRRNSADTAGMAPSVAAVWLLNQAQATHDSSPARALSDDAGDETITSSILRDSAAKDGVPNGDSLEQQKPRNPF